MIKLLEFLNEAPYIQKPKDTKAKQSPDLPGYNITGTDTDPVTGTITTHLEPEPKILSYAKDIGRMIKTLRHYEALPETETNKIIKSSILSTITSLRNAEGKLRDVHNKIKAFRELEK